MRMKDVALSAERGAFVGFADADPGVSTSEAIITATTLRHILLTSRYPLQLAVNNLGDFKSIANI